MVTKGYNLLTKCIEDNSMDRNPRSDDETEIGSDGSGRSAGGVASAAVTMRRLEGVPGEWWIIEGETDDQYVAASADSWVELGR